MTKNDAKIYSTVISFFCIRILKTVYELLKWTLIEYSNKEKTLKFSIYCIVAVISPKTNYAHLYFFVLGYAHVYGFEQAVK